MAPKLYRVRPQVASDAPEDPTLVIVNKEQAQKLGIELDPVGFPILASLAEWHKQNNPHLVEDEEEGVA